MSRFKIAHLNHQGTDMIIVPLDSGFGAKAWHEQNQAVSELQVRATTASLRGTIVPVWDAGGGRMAFIAPQPWHAFFQSVSLTWVWSNINKELYW